MGVKVVMASDKGNKYEIRHRALLEAIRFCGGVSAYSKILKVSRSRASNWLNQQEIEIPYEYVILTEEITQVSIERLSPFTQTANKVIRRLRSKDTLAPVNMPLNDILMGDHSYLKSPNEAQTILVGTDKVLISGLTRLEAEKAQGSRQSQVILLDLEALLLKYRRLRDIPIDLLISEQIAVGLRLQQILGGGQGKRNDLNKKNKAKDPLLIPNWGEVQGRRDIEAAKLIGYSANTYYRAKQVYLHGSMELISAMDHKKISIAGAYKIARRQLRQQPEHLQTLAWSNSNA